MRLQYIILVDSIESNVNSPRNETQSKIEHFQLKQEEARIFHPEGTVELHTQKIYTIESWWESMNDLGQWYKFLAIMQDWKKNPKSKKINWSNLS